MGNVAKKKRRQEEERGEECVCVSHCISHSPATDSTAMTCSEMTCRAQKPPRLLLRYSNFILPSLLDNILEFKNLWKEFPKRKNIQICCNFHKKNESKRRRKVKKVGRWRLRKFLTESVVTVTLGFCFWVFLKLSHKFLFDRYHFWMNFQVKDITKIPFFSAKLVTIFLIYISFPGFYFSFYFIYFLYLFPLSPSFFFFLFFVHNFGFISLFDHIVYFQFCSSFRHHLSSMFEVSEKKSEMILLDKKTKLL